MQPPDLVVFEHDDEVGMNTHALLTPENKNVMYLFLTWPSGNTMEVLDSYFPLCHARAPSTGRRVAPHLPSLSPLLNTLFRVLSV